MGAFATSTSIQLFRGFMAYPPQEEQFPFAWQLSAKTTNRSRQTLAHSTISSN
jgi:hypothetical protein